MEISGKEGSICFSMMVKEKRRHHVKDRWIKDGVPKYWKKRYHSSSLNGPLENALSLY